MYFLSYLHYFSILRAAPLAGGLQKNPVYLFQTDKRSPSSQEERQTQFLCPRMTRSHWSDKPSGGCSNYDGNTGEVDEVIVSTDGSTEEAAVHFPLPNAGSLTLNSQFLSVTTRVLRPEQQSHDTVTTRSQNHNPWSVPKPKQAFSVPEL